MKKFLTIVGCFITAIAIVMFTPSLRDRFRGVVFSEDQQVVGMFNQEVEEILEAPIAIDKLYHKGEFVGVITDDSKIEDLLKSIYKENYEENYPGTKASLSDELYLTEEKSYFKYANKDEEILSYIKDNELFALEATEVSFLNENSVYAQIYVLNEEMYQNAMNTFLSYFIDKDALALLTSGQETPQLLTYGSRDIGVAISETIEMKKAFVKPNQIMKSEEEIIAYLEYGGNTEKEYYTVKQYDTVAGVGSKNYGLSATQVMLINQDKITDVNQVLTEGMELCVTYFESPIHINVTKETLRQEPIYAETKYDEDPDMLVGTSEVVQEAIDGTRNALYTEKWVNGVLVNGSLKSSVDIKQPQNEIIMVGTMQPPDTGTGIFRYPVNNAYVLCGWGCYYGHRGTDFADRYDRWGKVYAADRGVISENSYNGINGNYVTINHNNGLSSYYGHMRVPSPLPVGTIVDKGQIIGDIGMTGWATAPHVHFFIFSGRLYGGEQRYNACAGYLPC